MANRGRCGQALLLLTCVVQTWSSPNAAALYIYMGPSANQLIDQRRRLQLSLPVIPKPFSASLVQPSFSMDKTKTDIFKTVEVMQIVIPDLQVQGIIPKEEKLLKYSNSNVISNMLFAGWAPDWRNMPM